MFSNNQRSTSGRGNQKKFQSRPNNNSSLIVSSGSGQRIVTIKNPPRQKKRIVDESIVFQGPLVKAPMNSSRAQISSLPSFNGSSGVRIKHRELLLSPGDSAASLAFALIERFRLNPGSKKTFKWLGTIGPCFETFKFRNVRLHYYPRCPTTTAGSLILSPDYDAADAPPSSEEQCSQNVGTKEDAPWKEIVMAFNAAMLNRTYKGHYIMTDSRFDSSSQDEKTIDPAQFFVCRDSAGVTIPWGKLWIEYDVDLFTPQTPEAPIDQGGGAIVAPTITTGSALPFAVAPHMNYGGLNDIIDNRTTAYPSDQLGTLLRDWKGALTSIGIGTGITVPGTWTAERDGVTLPSLFSDTVLNSAGTKWMHTQDFDLKAGDIIKRTGITATTVSTINGLLAAASYF